MPAMVNYQQYHLEERQVQANWVVACDGANSSLRGRVGADFITPKSRSSTRLRNAVLELARTEAFARPLVNSGRLSTPTPYLHSSLNTPDTQVFAGRMHPGTNCADAPITVNGSSGWLLNLLGAGFTLLSLGPAMPVTVEGYTTNVLEVGRDLTDSKGLVQQRCDGQPGTVYLIRLTPSSSLHSDC